MTINPYIIFNGNCEEALNFYTKALNGEIRGLMRFEGTPVEQMAKDKQKVMHSHFVVDGNILFMASDSGQGGPESPNGGMVHLCVNLEDRGKLENIFASMSEGGRVSMQLQDTFWGARFGMLTDRFGVNWMFNCETKK